MNIEIGAKLYIVLQIINQPSFHSIHEQFRSVIDTKLAKNILAVGHDGMKTNTFAFGYFFGREAFCY